MVWAVAQQIGRQAANLVTFLILAVLLPPRDFGILGMALTWIAFMFVFSEMGFSAALIQRSRIDSKHLSTTFFVNVGMGFVLCCAGVGLSWPSAIFFNTPEVQPVLAVLSIGFVVNSPSLTQIAIAQRELKFRTLAIRDISAAVIGGILGITLAFSGFGVWSLVGQSLSTSILGTALIWKMSTWRPRLAEISFDCIRDIWSYSSKIFSFNVFKYLTQNIDKLLIGYLLGPVALGIYTFAYKIVVFPITTLVGAIGGYLFPKFSKMQDDLKGIRSIYLLVLETTNSLVMPIMVVAVILSPTLLHIMFGAKWDSAIYLMQILTIVTIVQALFSPVGQLMKALNRPGWLLYWSVGFGLMTSACIWFGSAWDINGVGIGLAVAHLAGLPIVYIIAEKLVGVSMNMIVGALYPSLASSALIAFLLWSILLTGMTPEFLGVIVGLFACLVSYAMMLRWLNRRFFRDALQQLLRGGSREP